MEKAKMMLNSVLHETNKIDRSVLIKYYVNEYKSSNPIFLFQFFKLVFKHIYEKEDLEFLDLLIDNFYDEVCMYGHLATTEFNNIISSFILSNKLSYIIKISPFASEIGDKTTLKLMKKLLSSLELLKKYIDPKDMFVMKRSIYDLENKLKPSNQKNTIEILDQGIFVKWRKFECIK